MIPDVQCYTILVNTMGNAIYVQLVSLLVFAMNVFMSLLLVLVDVAQSFLIKFWVNLCILILKLFTAVCLYSYPYKP